MAAVVSDTSVINYLAALGNTELLRVQFQKIYIPPAVWRELHAKLNLPGTAPADAAQKAGWLFVQEPKPSANLNKLALELDPGEAEAIALACELKPAIVLLDETDGRAAARELGLTIIGTVGVLVRARTSGSITKIKPLLDCLIREHRFRLSAELYDEVVLGDPK